MPYLCTRFCVKGTDCLPASVVRLQECKGTREVAQLVAHHVRDVGVGRSSRLFSTNKKPV